MKRFAATRRLHWRRFQLGISLLSGAMLGAAGVVIWIDSLWNLPVGITDRVFLTHESVAWLMSLALPVRLWVARRRILRGIRRLAGLARASRSSC